MVHRAATGPGTLSGTGWAADVAQTAVSEFVASLGPMSAASQLFAQALQVPLRPGTSDVRIPGAIPTGIAGAFVEEGEPIPVTAWNFAAATLSSKKLAILTAITRELAKTGRAEREVRRLLREAAALTLDAYLFSDDAATDAAPAGLFYGLTPITTQAFDSDALVNDLTALVAAVAPIGGDRLAYVASPARAAQISMRVPALRFPVFASSAIPDTRIAAVALDALAVGIDPTPDIYVDSQASVHMSSEPLELVSDNPTTADPVRSFYQTASIGIRLILDCDWALRDPGAVAMVEGVAW